MSIKLILQKRREVCLRLTVRDPVDGPSMDRRAVDGSNGLLMGSIDCTTHTLLKSEITEVEYGSARASFLSDMLDDGSGLYVD